MGVKISSKNVHVFYECPLKRTYEQTSRFMLEMYRQTWRTLKKKKDSVIHGMTTHSKRTGIVLL